MRLLIVDDNAGLTALMKDMLEEEGICKVETAGDGETGYRRFMSFKPDIILTDIEMPVENGFEMVKKIRINHPEVKIIFMSGQMNRYRETIIKEHDGYSVNFLDKPFSFSKVVNMFDDYRNEMMNL